MVRKGLYVKDKIELVVKKGKRKMKGRYFNTKTGAEIPILKEEESVSNI